MESQIYSAEGFARHLHPSESSGEIVVIRKLNKRIEYAPVDARQFSQICRNAAGVSGLHFSLCGFFGAPLLLNVASVRGITLSRPLKSVPGNSTRDVADQVDLLLQENSLPLPSATIYDSEAIHFLWLLDSSVEGHEIYRLYILATGLERCLQKAGLSHKYKADIASTVPLVGSRHVASGSFVRVDDSSWRGTISRRHFEREVTAYVSERVARDFELPWNILRELQRLFHSRWGLFKRADDAVPEWLSAFAAALHPFCDSSAMRRELHALVESLIGEPWKQISSHWNAPLNNVMSLISEGAVVIGGESHSLASLKWREGLAQGLAISAEDIHDLSLHEICPSGLRRTSVKIIEPPRRPLHPFGLSVGTPLNRLLLTVAESSSRRY